MTILGILNDVCRSEDKFTIVLMFEKFYYSLVNSLNFVNMTKYVNVTMSSICTFGDIIGKYVNLCNWTPSCITILSKLCVFNFVT